MKHIYGWDKSLLREISSKKTSGSSGSIKRKLEQIKRKLRAGARLTAAEKAFLKEHAPGLYEEAMAMERERNAYEERLKKCRTREEAERVKTEKMMEMEAVKEEDAETKMMRMAQAKAAEEAAASAVNQKPDQMEDNKKQGGAEQERQETEKAQDRYIEKDRPRQTEEEDEAENAPGMIYRRPKRSATGEVDPLPKGMRQKTESGNGQGAFAKGYAAYQAALQEDREAAKDFGSYEPDE